MNLLDSNVVIAGAARHGEMIGAGLLAEAFSVSVVTRIEVLGFHRLTPEDEADLLEFLAAGEEFALNEPVVKAAVRLRRERRMGIADAIIAATALVHELTLVTRNVADFKHIADLKLHNPFDDSEV